MTSPEFVFTTLYPAPAGYQVPFLPRARTCIFRGMWADLPLNSRNKAEMNKKVFESDLLTLTTDFRMTKIPGIFMSSEETGDTSMSGGGGPVEAVFWIKEVGVQWRFKGEGYVVGKDIDHVTSKGARLVKKKVGERMRPINVRDIDGSVIEFLLERMMKWFHTLTSIVYRAMIKVNGAGTENSLPTSGIFLLP